MPPPVAHLQVWAVPARCLLLLLPLQLPQLSLARFHLLPQPLVLGRQQVPVLLRIRAALSGSGWDRTWNLHASQGAPACCPQGSPSPQCAIPRESLPVPLGITQPPVPREPQPTEGLSLPTAG